MYERTDSTDWNDSETQRDEVSAWLARDEQVTRERTERDEQTVSPFVRRARAGTLPAKVVS